MKHKTLMEIDTNEMMRRGAEALRTGRLTLAQAEAAIADFAYQYEAQGRHAFTTEQVVAMAALEAAVLNHKRNVRGGR